VRANCVYGPPTTAASLTELNDRDATAKVKFVVRMIVPGAGIMKQLVRCAMRLSS